MLRGIYTAASGMMNVQLATDVMANNLANVNTTGFKASYAQTQAKPEMELSRLDKTGQQIVGKLTTGVEMIGTPVHFSQGHLQSTENPLDMAIEGDALFAVQLPDGEIGYTRNGAFRVGPNGLLETHEGLPVLGTGNSTLTIPLDKSAVVVNESGTISTTKGVEIGELRRVRFPNPKGLQKVSDSIFRGDNPQEVDGQDLNGRVMQGYVERSNTNVVHEMIQSITGMRLYEGLQKSISAQNATLQKAVNDIK
jgi:flagellar basal body rod protein FlgG